MRRLGILALVGLALFTLSLDPVRGLLSLVFGWGVLGYLIVRALPAIRQDFRNLRGAFGGGRAGLPRRMRGMHL